MFTAGGSIHLGPDFWLETGIQLSANVDPDVADPFAFLTDGSPDAEATYNARFDLRLDSLNLAEGENIGHFSGYSSDGTLQFKVVLRKVASQNWLALFARDNDSGTLVEHSFDLLLGADFNAIQIIWRAGAGNGQFRASINGSLLAGLMTLDNATNKIDYVRWGLVDGNLDLTTGFIEINDFFSWR